MSCVAERSVRCSARDLRWKRGRLHCRALLFATGLAACSLEDSDLSDMLEAAEREGAELLLKVPDERGERAIRVHLGRWTAGREPRSPLKGTSSQTARHSVGATLGVRPWNAADGALYDADFRERPQEPPERDGAQSAPLDHLAEEDGRRPSAASTPATVRAENSPAPLFDVARMFRVASQETVPDECLAGSAVRTAQLLEPEAKRVQLSL